MIATYQDNPVLPQDMVEHAFRRFRKTGYILPHRQRVIYENLAVATGRQSIIEAGCGIGLGTSILKRLDHPFIYKGEEAVHRIAIGTDFNHDHLYFARQMFPACQFDFWDISAGPYPAKLYDAVVAVEVIEHVANYQEALRNLILTCRQEVWLSTPNRNSPEIDPHQPRNPYHVHEFCPEELVALVQPLVSRVELYSWAGLTPVEPNTEVTPLVYRLVL